MMQVSTEFNDKFLMLNEELTPVKLQRILTNITSYIPKLVA